MNLTPLLHTNTESSESDSSTSRISRKILPNKPYASEFVLRLKASISQTKPYSDDRIEVRKNATMTCKRREVQDRHVEINAGNKEMTQLEQSMT